MKNGAPCPKCGADEIIFLPRITDFQESAIAAHVASSRWSSQGRLELRGVFLAYICRACGFTELYAHQPEGIPVDRIKGAAIRKARAPYR